MKRQARVLGFAVVLIAVAAVAAGCSSAKKADLPATTPTAAASVPASTTSGPASSATSSSTAPGATTTSTGPTGTTVAGPGPRITGFTISPRSPVPCNAPTMIQLQWTATGAASVALSIDGKLFAAFGGGAQDHLEYLACDGKAHTYLLTALGTGRNASVSKVVVSQPAS